MVDVSTDELIEAFLDASAAAEVNPTTEILCTLQELCAALARMHGGGWAAEGALFAGESSGAGLDESTILPDDERGHRSARDLVREARGYVRLGLYDLAEGAVSRAVMLHADDVTAAAETWSDSKTGQYRLTDLAGGPARAFFSAFSRDATIGWLVTCGSGRPTPVASWPHDQPHTIDPVVLDAGASLVALGAAFQGFCTMCLLLHDGLWFVGVDEASVAMLRFPLPALGGLISRMRTFDPRAATET